MTCITRGGRKGSYRHIDPDTEVPGWDKGTAFSKELKPCAA